MNLLFSKSMRNTIATRDRQRKSNPYPCYLSNFMHIFHVKIKNFIDLLCCIIYATTVVL